MKCVHWRERDRVPVCAQAIGGVVFLLLYCQCCCKQILPSLREKEKSGVNCECHPTVLWVWLNTCPVQGRMVHWSLLLIKILFLMIAIVDIYYLYYY